MLVSWKERPIPARVRRAALQPVMSSPLKAIRPSEARYCPERRLKSVVFPAPLGPMMLLSARAGTSRLTWSTATWPPKRIVRSRVLRTGASAVAISP